MRPGSLPEPAGVRWWLAGRVRGRALEPVLLVLVELGGRGAAFSTLPGRRSGAIRDFPGGHLVCPALCGDRAHPAAPSPTLCGRTGFSRCISRRVPSLRQCRRCWVLATTHWPQGPGCEGGRGADWVEWGAAAQGTWRSFECCTSLFLWVCPAPTSAGPHPKALPSAQASLECPNHSGAGALLWGGPTKAGVQLRWEAVA